MALTAQVQFLANMWTRGSSASPLCTKSFSCREFGGRVKRLCLTGVHFAGAHATMGEDA